MSTASLRPGVPNELKYTRTHEWAQLMDDGTLRIGITAHAQDLLGDMVFVELPAIGRYVAAAQECAVVESVKAASDIYSPVAGEVIAVNEALTSNPELVNKDPYGEGWLMRLKPSNGSADLNGLLTAAAYAEMIAAEAH